jgi:O-antigen/teichoic acid export membrane protein
MVGYLTLADIGLYTVALKIASLFRLLDSAFRMAWGPFMWEHFERPGHQEIYQRVMKVVTAGVFTLVLLTALFTDEILALLTTEEYASAAPLIGVLAFSIGLTIVGQIVWLGPAIRKRTEYNTLAVYISVGVNILLLYVLVPAYGLIGVAACMLASTTVSLVLGWSISERLYYVGFSKAFFEVGYLITLVVVVASILFPVSLFFQMAIMTAAGILFLTMLATGSSPIIRMPLRKTARRIGLRLPD